MPTHLRRVLQRWLEVIDDCTAGANAAAAAAAAATVATGAATGATVTADSSATDIAANVSAATARAALPGQSTAGCAASAGQSSDIAFAAT